MLWQKPGSGKQHQVVERLEAGSQRAVLPWQLWCRVDDNSQAPHRQQPTHTNTHTMYVVLSKCALHVLDVSHFSPKHYYYIILNNNKPSVQPLMVVLSLYQHRCKRAFWPKVDFLLSPLSFSSLLPWDTTVHHSPKEPASYRTGEHIWSSRQAICSPEPQWDLINTATVDRGGECGCCGLPALTGIMDQLFGHSGLIVPAAWPLWFLLPHLFVSTLLIKELGSRIP